MEIIGEVKKITSFLGFLISAKPPLRGGGSFPQAGEFSHSQNSQIPHAPRWLPSGIYPRLGTFPDPAGSYSIFILFCVLFLNPISSRTRDLIYLPGQTSACISRLGPGATIRGESAGIDEVGTLKVDPQSGNFTLTAFICYMP